MPKLNSGSQDHNFLRNLLDYERPKYKHQRQPLNPADHLPEVNEPGQLFALSKAANINNLKLQPGDTVKYFDGQFVYEATFSSFEKGKYYLLDKQGFIHMAVEDKDLVHERYLGAKLRNCCTQNAKNANGYEPHRNNAIVVFRKPELKKKAA